MGGFEFLEGDAGLLEEVGPLWEQLRVHHELRAHYFADRFARITFAERRAELLQKGRLRVDLARANAAGRFVGYCLSSISAANVGEIESLYVEEDCRGCGLGEQLMQRALAWMDGERTAKKIVAVAEGNEAVFPFYARFGFKPRLIVLEQQKLL